MFKFGHIPEIRRDSNFELYRIVCMFFIVAHHYVVNSGLIEGPMADNPIASNSIFLSLFGMWGKIGINSFILITGYYMCEQTISLRKFLKLLLECVFYTFTIYIVFLFTGVESFSLIGLLARLFPVWDFGSNFVVSYLFFYLTIPFWNILIHSVNEKQHLILIFILLFIFSIVGNIPYSISSVNYVFWFGVIYLISSYIRLYPSPFFNNLRLWTFASVASIIIAVLSVLGMTYIFKGRGMYFFVADSNKFLAVVVSFSTFLLFKNIKLPNSRIINYISASTFAVLLIHANCDTMRQWLWGRVVQCCTHYYLPFSFHIFFCFSSVLAIFAICVVLDRLRIIFIERPLFKKLDNKYSLKSYW